MKWGGGLEWKDLRALDVGRVGRIAKGEAGRSLEE